LGKSPRPGHDDQPHAYDRHFLSPLRRSTVVGSALAFVAVFGLWGSTNWAPTLIRELPDLKGSDAATLSASVSYAIMALNGEPSSAIWGWTAG